MATCEECGFRPMREVAVASHAFKICWDCSASHCYVGLMPDGSVREQQIIDGDPYSPDGVIWYAPDMMRHADGRPVEFVESFGDWFERQNFPPICVQVNDPKGLLGPDHPKEFMIGGPAVSVN